MTKSHAEEHRIYCLIVFLEIHLILKVNILVRIHVNVYEKIVMEVIPLVLF